jgi:hypothetical protein
VTDPTKRRLEDRINGLEAEADGAPGEVVAPPASDFPLTVFLSAGEETCVDDYRRLHEIGGRQWQFPQKFHDAVIGRGGGGLVLDYFTRDDTTD